MGQTPAKFFALPTPYGNSPDMGTLAQAKAASPAPLNNFLPLNPQDSSQNQPQPQDQSGLSGWQANYANNMLNKGMNGGAGNAAMFRRGFQGNYDS